MKEKLRKIGEDSGISEESLTDAFERALLFKVDSTNLSEEVENQPSTHRYIGEILAIAQSKRNAAKIELKVVRARRAIDLSQTTMPGTNKRPTVEVLKAMVDSDPQVIGAEAELIKAEKVLLQIQADYEASAQKYRMLELMGALLKQELYMKGYLK